MKKTFGLIPLSSLLQLRCSLPTDASTQSAVKIGDKWGYIDKNGVYAISPQFETALQVSQKWAANGSISAVLERIACRFDAFQMKSLTLSAIGGMDV